jgi:transposase
MEVVHERCCGLDVHKKSVTACLIVPGPDGLAQKEIRSFGTMTADLLSLADWLTQAGVTHVAMESTGVYWKPVWNILEDRFELILANAQHTKPLKGKKTDIKDCEWVADFLQHGLIRPSFVPDRDQRELRELTRYRTTLVRERSAELNRLQKTLEGANVKLASVVSDINGKSAREMMAALVGGVMDVDAVANLAKGRLREKVLELQRALAGRFAPHQRFMLAQQLAHIDQLDANISALEAEIEERMRPFADAVAALDSIPGVGPTTAHIIIAEIGTDMSQFQSARRLASWAKMCPGNDESAGKRRSGRTGKGDRWLKATLTESAHAAARGKNYLSSQYHRLVPRRGKKKAAIAVGHSILVIVFNLLSNPGSSYQDLGVHYFDERDKEKLKNRLVHRLEGLGFNVTLGAA